MNDRYSWAGLYEIQLSYMAHGGWKATTPAYPKLAGSDPDPRLALECLSDSIRIERGRVTCGCATQGGANGCSECAR